MADALTRLSGVETQEELRELQVPVRSRSRTSSTTHQPRHSTQSRSGDEEIPVDKEEVEGESHHDDISSSSDDDDDDDDITPADPNRHPDTTDPESGRGLHKSRSRASSTTNASVRRTASNVLSRVASRLTTRDWPEPPPPPDGGAKAWTQVAMAFLVLFTTWGYVNSFGSWQAYYEITLSEAPSTISWIGSVQVWFTFSISAFSGRALDAGLYVPTAALGATLQVLGLFLMSISTKFWQLVLTQGVLTGIGGGIIFTPSVSLLSTYFSKKRGIAVGMATIGNAVGGLVYPVIVRELLPRAGFAWTARAIGFLNLGCFVVVLSFMRPRLPPRKAGPIIDWSAFKEGPFVAVVCAIFSLTWCTYYTFNYIASYATRALHMDYSQASILVIVINAAGLPTRAVYPLLADRYGYLNCIIPTTLILSIVAYTWLGVRTIPQYYAFTIIYGAVNGAMQSQIPVTVASLTKRLDMLGTRLGMAFTIVSFAALSGPPLGGALQAAQGEGKFSGAEAWAASAMLLSSVAFLATRTLHVGWKLKVFC